MPRVDLVLKVWLSILAKEDRTLDLVFGALARFDVEAQLNEVCAEHGERLITGQTLFQLLRVNLFCVPFKYGHNGACAVYCW